jgi:DNA damage-binding protein 1
LQIVFFALLLLLLFVYILRRQLVLELGLQAPEADDKSPWAKGAVTFCAFILFGSVPLLSYIIASEAGAGSELLFGLCIIFTLGTIFSLGAVSGHFSQVIKS